MTALSETELFHAYGIDWLPLGEPCESVGRADAPIPRMEAAEYSRPSSRILHDAPLPAVLRVAGRLHSGVQTE